jgi:hypothetical protein
MTRIFRIMHVHSVVNTINKRDRGYWHTMFGYVFPDLRKAA